MPLSDAQLRKAICRSRDVRSKRAKLKREVKAGEVKLSELLAEVELPDWLVGMETELLLAAVHGISPKGACGLLAELRIPERKPLGKLTYRQRRVIASHVKVRWEHEPEEAKGESVRARPHVKGGRAAAVPSREWGSHL